MSNTIPITGNASAASLPPGNKEDEIQNNQYAAYHEESSLYRPVHFSTSLVSSNLVTSLWHALSCSDIYAGKDYHLVG